MRCTGVMVILLCASAGAEPRSVRTEVDAAGTEQIPIDVAPSILPEKVGCISSARHALVGAGEDPDELLHEGEIRTSENTALLRLETLASVAADGSPWGLMWAQIACAGLPDAWPMGTTEHEWACGGLIGLSGATCAIEGAVTWMLAAGAGEGDEHVLVHVPPSQRARWRPLGLVRAEVVELFMRDVGCSLQYVYKGTRHPTNAPRCDGDDSGGDGDVGGGGGEPLARTSTPPMLLHPPPAGWYAPPDDGGTSFRSSATIRWLTRFAFASRGAHSMLVASDAPRANGGYSAGPHAATDVDWKADEELMLYRSGEHRYMSGALDDGMVITASECLHARCAAPLALCYKVEACREGWSAFAETQGRVPWNQSALDAARRGGGAAGSEDPASSHLGTPGTASPLDPRPSTLDSASPMGSAQLPALVECFATRCTCQARDGRQHAVRFTGALFNTLPLHTMPIHTRDGRPHAVRFTEEDGLSDVEITSIVELAREIGSSTRRAFGIHEGGLPEPGQKRKPIVLAAGHNVTFLHGRFASVLPALHAKLLRHAHRAHAQAGWRVLEAGRAHVRTIELLEYVDEADSLGWHAHAHTHTHIYPYMHVLRRYVDEADSLGWHVDEQSAVTVLALLSGNMYAYLLTYLLTYLLAYLLPRATLSADRLRRRAAAARGSWALWSGDLPHGARGCDGLSLSSGTSRDASHTWPSTGACHGTLAPPWNTAY